jgi:hypothetical protein
MSVPSSARFKESLEDELEDGFGDRWRVVLREGVESMVDIADERRVAIGYFSLL